MAAGAAALTLTATMQAAPAAQADEVAARGRLHRQPDVEHDAPRRRQPDRPLLAQRGQPRRAAVGRRRRPGRARSTRTTSATASGVGGWPYNAGAPVDSSPSVAPISPNGTDSVFVGERRTPATPPAAATRPSPTPAATSGSSQETNPGTDPTPHSGVAASLTVGVLRRRLRRGGGFARPEHVCAGRRQRRHARRASRGSRLTRCSRRPPSPTSTPTATTRSSAVATPAPALAYGADLHATAGTSASCRARGNAGTGNPAGGLICQYNTNQNIDRSSPAVGQFLGGGAVGIAIGDGSFYSGASDSNKVFAINTGCGLAWSDQLNGVTADSPALANVQGNGQLDVVEGTAASTVYVLNGTNGAAVWSAPTTGQVIGSPVTADLTGGGYQDVIVPTTDGIDIFDGRSGAEVATLGTNFGFQSSPLVTDDPDGHIGITGAGYGGGGRPRGTSRTGRSTTPAAPDRASTRPGAWPQFHHDPQLTGDAGTPAPTVEVPCNAPAGAPNGYLLSASDGGVFNYGNIPFCGSTGSIHLNRPVVASAMTHDGGGYWEVASDGGIFAFGNAQLLRLHGRQAAQPARSSAWRSRRTAAATGSSPPTAASSASATPPSSAARASIHLNRPIVGMAATPSGNGYWLVASDGGIFSYGDAKFAGSMGGRPLNSPVVGMAADAQTGGYWEVAADGGIFSFGAPFYGSTGSIHLNAPIVGMEASGGGAGYRFVASDGGIFSYNAPFYGSMGGKPLNKPVVSMAGT